MSEIIKYMSICLQLTNNKGLTMNSIIASIVGAIIRIIPPDLLKTSVGALINHLEDKIKNDGKENWEDTAILPLLEALKRQLGIA